MSSSACCTVSVTRREPCGRTFEHQNPKSLNKRSTTDLGGMGHASCSAHGSLVDKKSHFMPTVGRTDDRCIRLCSDGCAQCRREGYQASGKGKSAFWALCVWRPAAYNSRRGGGLEHRSLVTWALRRFHILFSRLRSIRVCIKSVRDSSLVNRRPVKSLHQVCAR